MDYIFSKKHRISISLRKSNFVLVSVEEAGGQSLPCKVDAQNVNDIKSAIQKGVEKFGGIDIVINVASTFFPTPMLQTDVDKLDLMYNTIVRSTFATFVLSYTTLRELSFYYYNSVSIRRCKLCYPYLKNSTHAHILNLSPPLNLDRVWMKRHMAHTAAKYSISMYTLGMAEEFRDDKIAANSLWPKTCTCTRKRNIRLKYL